jgi:hypothetical protein
MIIKKIGINTLEVDRRVQRELNTSWVAKMARDLILDQLGIITVSLREDGSTVILDGQHRVEALRHAGIKEYEIDCRVLTDLSLEEEARTFRLLNSTSKPNKIDHFLVRVVEGDEVARDINKILNRFGWQASRGKSAGSFSAISTLEALYRKDREAAWSTIQTVTEAWGNSLESANGQIIFGIGGVYHRHGDGVDIARMVRRLSNIAPKELLTRAAALAKARGRRAGAAVAELAIAEYNKYRGPKLPDWNLPRQAKEIGRKAGTELIRALAKVANENVTDPTPVPVPVDAAELFRAMPDELPVWR